MKPEYVYMNVIAPSCNLIPVIIGFVRFRRLPPAARVLLAYLCLNSLINTASSLLAYRHISNAPLFHFSVIAETLLLLLFFKKLFVQKNSAAFLGIMMMVFPLLCLLNMLFLQPLTVFNSYTFSLQNILLIICCFLYWWNVHTPEHSSWQAFPMNWIISGLMLYFASAFLLFTLINVGVFYFRRADFILLWNIHATLTIVEYIFMSIGFSKYAR